MHELQFDISLDHVQSTISKAWGYLQESTWLWSLYVCHVTEIVSRITYKGYKGFRCEDACKTEMNCGSLILINYACLVRYDEFTAPIRCLSIQTIFANVVYVTTVPFDRAFDIYQHNLFKMGVCDVWLWCFYCMKSTLYSLDTTFFEFLYVFLFVFLCFWTCIKHQTI